MKIYMARHGQTQLNAEDRVCGRTDVPLTELGLQQAEKLADNAEGKDIDIIIVSPICKTFAFSLQKGRNEEVNGCFRGSRGGVSSIRNIVKMKYWTFISIMLNSFNSFRISQSG